MATVDGSPYSFVTLEPNARRAGTRKHRRPQGVSLTHVAWKRRVPVPSVNSWVHTLRNPSVVSSASRAKKRSCADPVLFQNSADARI